MRLKRRPRNNRRGTAMVEMALVLPLFFMLLLGIIEFGRAMMISNLVTNAAREGARMAILTGSTNTQVIQAAQDFMTSATNVAASDVSVTITITPYTGNPDPGNNVYYAHQRDLISVSVTVPFNDVALIPGEYLAGKQLLGQCAMRHE